MFESENPSSHSDDANGSAARVLLKTWCHQCKMRKARVTACDNFFSTDKEKRCNGRYCDGCVQRHYLEDAAEFASLPHWICFRCTGRCTCAACKRRRKGDDGGMGLDGSVGGAGGSEVGSSGPASSVRRREPKRYADELELDDDDDDFDPLPQTATRRPEVRPPQMMVRASAPKAPKMEQKQPSSMSALALLAEESLTAEFVPGAQAADLLVQHTAELARLRDTVELLQAQVMAVVQRLDHAKQNGSSANANPGGPGPVPVPPVVQKM